MKWVFWLSIIIGSGAALRIAYICLQAQFDDAIAPEKEIRTLLKAVVIFVLIPTIIALIKTYFT